jgi:capsular exopolysaccharide synthesis family protein
MSQQSPNTVTEFEEIPVDWLVELSKYLRYWYWFLLSAVVFVLGANVYLRYTPNSYQTAAKIKILDNSTNSFKMPTDAISLFAKSKLNLENEVEVIKSHRIMQMVVQKLNLTTSYYQTGYVKSSELWEDRPFTIEWIGDNNSLTSNNIQLAIKLKDNGYVLSQLDEKAEVKQFGIIYKKDKEISYKITKNQNYNSSIPATNEYGFRLLTTAAAAAQLVGQIGVENIGKQSEILALTITGTNKDKSESILNTLLDQFDWDGIRDRQLISQRTIDFVNERFVNLTRELDSIETGKEAYKRNNELSYLEADAGISAEIKTKSDAEVFDVETQVELSKLLAKTLQSDKKISLLPANIGVTNSQINNLIEQYNSLVLEREKGLLSAGEKNPITLAATQKIKELQQNILASVAAYQKQLGVTLAKYNALKSQNRSLYSTIPAKEKMLRSIERQQKIKETLYLLLLQKREEAAINKAITAPSIKVVDYAITGNAPVSPKRQIIFLGALLLGLLLPFGILYLYFLLDNKIHSKQDIERVVPETPVIAEIPNIKGDQMYITDNDRSILAESFRILRTNINYVMPFKPAGEGQIVYVTSTIKGEGKTFTSVNLALILASMQKKVLLLGSDLRNPQLHKFLNLEREQKGVSGYLYDTSIAWKSLVHERQLGNNHLDVILAGSIPPNPAELLSNGRFELLLSEVKQEYDYVIVDCAPTILVTDTLLISQLADVTLYLTRAGFTEIRLLQFSKELKQLHKLKNMSYVLNNVGDSKSYGYNYSYNYGYNYGYEKDDDYKVETSVLGKLRKKMRM